MTNSPLSRTMAYEYRSGRSEIYVIGGFVERIPVHATVSAFTLLPSEQVTIAGGTGAHLHFEVRVNGTRVDAEGYVNLG